MNKAELHRDITVSIAGDKESTKEARSVRPNRMEWNVSTSLFLSGRALALRISRMEWNGMVADQRTRRGVGEHHIQSSKYPELQTRNS